MKEIPVYQVDAFARQPFSGNSACVCPLDSWLEEEFMQKIAMENNQAETAFFVQSGSQIEIRWFSPTVEIDLCGHATLASAFILFTELGFVGNKVEFSSKKGSLIVRRDADLLTLDFPRNNFSPANLDEHLIKGLGQLPNEVYKGDVYLLIFDSEDHIKAIHPDFEALAKAPSNGVIVSARGKEVDYVSRFFAPKMGIPEDPATGSAQTLLLPFWADRLGKEELSSIQLSNRVGYFEGRVMGNRVHISGKAFLYSSGKIFLN